MTYRTRVTALNVAAYCDVRTSLSRRKLRSHVSDGSVTPEPSSASTKKGNDAHASTTASHVRAQRSRPRTGPSTRYRDASVAVYMRAA